MFKKQAHGPLIRYVVNKDTIRVSGSTFKARLELVEDTVFYDSELVLNVTLYKEEVLHVGIEDFDPRFRVSDHIGVEWNQLELEDTQIEVQSN